MTVGAAVGAATAVPLSHLGNGWRTPLLVFSAVSVGLGCIWLFLTRHQPAHLRTDVRPLRLPWRNPLGWRLVFAFFFMSSVFYGLNAWLPDAYVERGWSEGSAGALVAILNTLTIPVGFAIAWVADHRGQRRAWLTGAASLQLAGLIGVAAVPSAGWVWAVVLGIAIGPLFPLTMTLPLDAAARPAEVASLVGMMLGVGYTLSATAPLLLGAIRDLTGGFAAVLWTLVAVGAALVAIDASFSPERLRAVPQGSM
jgi:CP family cyanate transporter-like MFS transporter